MKKMIAVLAVVLSVCLLTASCGIIRKTATGKNAKVDYTGEASVSFYPVCPECNHVSPRCYVNISDGEYVEDTYICEKCYEVYEITIDRR